MDRREFFATMLGGVAGASLLGFEVFAQPRKRALSPEVAAALDALRGHIVGHCTNLGHANAAVHGVRALGRNCPLGSGDPFRILLENLLHETFVGDRVRLEVPLENEGHRHAMLKTLLEKGCEPDLEFAVQGRPYRFRDYIESARALYSYPGKVDIDEHSWAIMAFALTLPPGNARWQNYRGETLDLDRMLDDTSQALWQDTALVRRVDLAARPLPRDCPALGRACGALHMLYAQAVALTAGHSNTARRDMFSKHIRTLLRRLDYDLAVIDEVEALNVPLAGQDAAMITAFDARIKFLGHALEIFGRSDAAGLCTLSGAERKQVDAARSRLCTLAIENRKLDLRRYQADPALFDSLTTSLCHAYNGLALSPV